MTIFFSNIYMKKLINLGGCLFYSFMIFENTKNRELKKMYGHNFFSSFNEYVCFIGGFFNNFLKMSIKENFIFLFRGGGYFRGGGKKKNSKKCKEIILHPSEFFTMEIKVQFWIRYQ